MVDLEWLTPELLPWGISAFSICFLCSQRLSHLLTLDALLTFVTTIWVAFFPRDWLATELSPASPIDALHEYILTHVTLILMVPAMVWFLSTDPADITIRTALALSRIVGFGTASVLTVVAYREESLFNPKSFLYTVLTLSTLTVVYVVHLFYHSIINADRRVGNLNPSLFMDLCMAMSCGAVCLAVPHIPANFLFEQELNPAHTFLYRLYGALTLGYCCLPGFAPRFRSSANKRAVLFSRALSMLVILLMTFRKYQKGDISEGVGGKLMMATLVIVTLPSAIGCFRHEYTSGWDLPWKGLRLPHVVMGGSPAENIYQAAKDLQKITKSSTKKLKGQKRKRSRGRGGRSRSRRR